MAQLKLPDPMLKLSILSICLVLFTGVLFYYADLNIEQFTNRGYIGGVVTTSNAIVNNSFENPLSTSFVANGTGEFWLDSANKKTGARSIAVRNTSTQGSSARWQTQNSMLQIAAGTQYIASVSTLTKNVNGSVELRVDYVNSSNPTVVNQSQSTKLTDSSTSWRNISVTSTAPSNSNLAIVSIGVSGTGEAYFDDLTFAATNTGGNGGGTTPTPTATPTSSPTPGNTSLLPNFKGKYVNEPNGGNPNVSTAAITAAGGETNIPKCPEAMHDDKNWHPLFVPPEMITSAMAALVTNVDLRKTGCHYDHVHNANPSIGDAVFGPAGSLWGGQTISYPWETFLAGGENDPLKHENHMKHEGYKYAVELNLPIGRDGTGLNWAPGNNNRITDLRIQYHALGGQKDFNVRLHSYYAEYKVCSKDDYSKCGIMKFGGWADYGVLHSPYKTTLVPLPADPNPITQPLFADPYRAHKTKADAIALGQNSSANCKTCGNSGYNIHDIWWLWTTSPGEYGYNQIGGLAIHSSDDWQGVNASNPTEDAIVCDPKTNPCRFNNSEHLPATVWTRIKPEWDNTSIDKDSRAGFFSYKGYTKRTGDFVDGCTNVGLDCVPVEITGVPVGYGSWNSPADNFKWEERFKDYDTSPGKAWWIEYPN